MTSSRVFRSSPLLLRRHEGGVSGTRRKPTSMLALLLSSHFSFWKRSPSIQTNNTLRRFLTSMSTATPPLSDLCDKYIVKSPFPNIPSGPYPPFYEFVTSHWGRRQNKNEDNTNSSTSIPLDQMAIYDSTTGLQRTYGQHQVLAQQMASFLAVTQLRSENNHPDATTKTMPLPPTTVAIYCPNHVDYLPIVLGVSMTGSNVTPINPLGSVYELRSILERSNAAVLVVHISRLDVALEALGSSSSSTITNVQHVVVVTDEDNGGGSDNSSSSLDSSLASSSLPLGVTHLSDIRRHDPADDAISSFSITRHVHDTANHTLTLPYSSGTTGLPKGVNLTHANVIANLLQCHETEGPQCPVGSRLLSPLPFFHIYAFTLSMVYAAWRGQTVYTNSGPFDLEQFLHAIQAHRVTRAHLVPPILLALAKNPLVKEYDLSSLQMIISAAAPLGHEVEKAVEERLPNCRVKQAWGMSELSPIGTTSADDAMKPESIGPLVTSTMGKIIHAETGDSLPPGQDGELLIKGPQVMKGYLNDEAETAECLSASTGWLRTGDIARYDEDGYFYITDRIKELIKVRGWPVAPAELEALLLTHPAVTDCAVIGIPDERSQELPRAYVVPKKPSTEDDDEDAVMEQDIYAWVKERVGPSKRLDGGVEFVSQIPKSASGKILRRILRDQYSASAAATPSAATG